MRKSLLLFVILLLTSHPVFAQDQTAGAVSGEWIKFTSSDNSYSAMFPAQPKTEVETKPHSTTVLQLYANQGIVYGSACTDYDIHIDPKVELVANRDNFLKETGETLVTSKEIEFERAPNDRLPALVFTGEGGGAAFKGLVIVDGQRTYMFIGGGRGNVFAGAEKFLDSVRLSRVSK